MTVADWVIGFAMALGATFLPMVMFYIAFFKADSAASAVQTARAKVDELVRSARPNAEPGTIVLRETNTIEDPRALATIRQGAEYLRSRLQAA